MVGSHAVLLLLGVFSASLGSPRERCIRLINRLFVLFEYVNKSEKMRLLLIALLSLAISVSADPVPGLLRVPRVYNALVTSNQNLSPSRAFPVIQPVVHTTAVGYVPPFYYTQFAPRYPGPEAGRLPQEFLPAEGGAGLRAELTPAKDATRSNAEDAIAVPSNNDNNSNRKEDPAIKSTATGIPKRKDGSEHPLSFYPNYHSLYYDPYFYSYNGYNPHLAPNPYLFDYQPQDLAPLPPQGAYRDNQLLSPQLPEIDADQSGKNAVEDKIPDVPPPPVPTSSPSRS